MILIIGGAFQGKQEYAKALWERQEQSGRVVPEISSRIRSLAEQGTSREEMKAWAWKFAREHERDMVILEEVGYGIVPMEATDRLFRELVGTVGQVLAGFASEVHRVSCGIGMRLK